MLRSFWMLCLTCVGLLGALPSNAEAQLHRKDVRLYLDSQFVSWNSERVRSETAANQDHFSKTNTTGVGLLGAGGVGLAYVVSSHIVPGAYFSLQHAKTRTEVEVGGASTEGTSRYRQWELRPYLEVPFNPGSRFVVHATGGLSLMRWVRESPDTQAFGVGPVVGLGAHGFVSSKFSLDLGLMFRAAFVKNDDAKDALEAAGNDDVRFRNLAVLFNVGVSFWL